MAGQEGSRLLPPIKFALIATITVLLLVMSQETGTLQGPRSAEASAVIKGDVDCSGVADAVDSLQVLLSKAGLTASTQCLDERGDVNCDDVVDAVDSVHILHYVADNVQALEGCSPRGLAARLYAATDPADVEATLLGHVYPEINVGVYTGDGQQILDGAETDIDNDFYLYDFESALLAGNYVERNLYGLDVLTTLLVEAGIFQAAGGQPMTGADLLSRIASEINAARADESMFTWRLIDELGLAQQPPLDLTQPSLDPATTYLDPLQVFLILYDMSGLPSVAGSTAEDVGAEADPEAPTRALHDFSLLIQGYSLFVYPVSDTKWKENRYSSMENREVVAFVSFEPAPELPEAITTGPLKGVALPRTDENGGVAGATVDWFTDPDSKTEGTLVGPPSSRISNAEGEAINKFVPFTECPANAGQPMVIEVFLFKTVARLRITSLFPPHNELDVVSLSASDTPIFVSHHGPPHQGPSPESSAASIEGTIEFPCTYEGSASATQVQEYVGGNITYTITASDLRFELAEIGTSYDLVGGSVEVLASGTVGACTISGGSSMSSPIAEGDHYFSGRITVDVSTDKYLATGFAEDLEHHVIWTCEGGGGQTTSYATSWLRTTAGAPDRTFAGGPLAGSFDWSEPGRSGHTEWNLHPAGCQPSPEPVCSGTPAIPEGIN